MHQNLERAPSATALGALVVAGPARARAPIRLEAESRGIGRCTRTLEDDCGREQLAGVPHAAVLLEVARSSVQSLLRPMPPLGRFGITRPE